MDTKSFSNSAKKDFCRLGCALFAAAAATTGLQLLLNRLCTVLTEHGSMIPESDWFMWVCTFVPLYAVGIPLALLIMKKVPRSEQQPISLGGKNFFLFLLMCFTFMYGGNLIGTLLSSLLSGGTDSNALFGFIFDDSPLKLVVVVVLAPILEEYLFRRQLIDRCVCYGEKSAILFSALTFGLFHMNLYQFFYAFGLGLVFAYVYTRTRRLRYSVIMHMFINFLGSFLAPLLLSKVDTEVFQQIASGQIANVSDAQILAMLPNMLGYLLYAFSLIGLSIAGLFILIAKAPRLLFLPAEKGLPQKEGFRTIYCNLGMILFILFCIAIFVLNIIR